MPIDPSKVMWDAAPKPTAPQIDPAKVTWDPPAQATSAPPPVAAVSPVAPKIDASRVKWDEPPSAAAEAVRGFGIGARGLAQGALDLPAMVTDNLVAKPINAGLDALMGKGEGPRMKMLGESAGDLMTRAGVPEAKTASERVVQDISRGAGGAVAGLGAGAVAAKAASPVFQAVGTALQEAPRLQVASGAASGAASGVTREAGGGEGAQLAAGLAGGLAPAVGSFATKAALRGAIRGGEAGRQQMADNIETFEKAAGTTPTLGQATQSRTIQATETALSNVPGSAGLMARRGEVQSKALQDSVQELTEKLAPNATGWGAGEAIARGVNAFKDSVKTTQGMLYRKLDEFIPLQTPVAVNRTREALAALNDGIDGAPSLSQFFRNAKIGNIERALLNDLDAFSKGSVPPGMQGMGVAAPPGQLPYQALQKLRTMVGQEISESSLVSDVPRSKWRALYAALSDDLGSAAEQAGPAAQQAWSRANQYTRASIQRLEQLESVVNRDAPEKIFKAATSGMSDGGTQIARVMKSMPLENRQEVAAAVLQRLGRARNSAQNEMGDAFSSETFLTNLAAMSPQARMALFANSGFPGLRQKVEQMGRMASLRREGAQVFANPSGTARQAGIIGWGSGLMAALATGNALGIAALLGGAAAARTGASLVTNPKNVKWLAQETTLSPATPAIVINTANQSAQTEEPPPSRAQRMLAEMERMKQRRQARQGG